MKVNPPLRTKADAEALLEGVLDGTIDCIVTDHAPHADYEKDVEFEKAPFGMTGIETSVGLIVSNLVNTGKITWQQVVQLMSIAPRQIIRAPRVALEAGSPADLTIIDPQLQWTVSANEFESRSNNSGFIGVQITGRPTDTYVAGVAVMQDGKVE